MNYNDSMNSFQSNPKIKENGINKINFSEKEEESFKEEKLTNRLTLRKKKLQEKLYNKRGIKLINNFHFANNKNNDKIIFSKEDFLTGELYDNLNNAYKTKNENEIIKILYGLICFSKDKQYNNIEIMNILIRADSSFNIQNNIKSRYFPLAFLVLEIGINTNNKIIYLYSLNFLLNISFISNDFCKEIINEKILNEIFNKLIYFYPLFIQDKNIGDNYNNILGIYQEGTSEEATAFFFGSQILKLLGNLYLSVDSYEIFKSIKFYEKIFYLLSVFFLDNENEKYLKYQYEYLDTLLWLLYIIFIKDENISINYSENIFNLIPNLLDYIIALYYTDEVELLEKIIFLIEIISDINKNYLEKIVELDGIKILTNLFEYLFSNENVEIKLTPEITDRILGIFINIFTIDSKYFQNFDFSQFSMVYEKLFSMYKFEHSNFYHIQNNLLLILSNIACLNNNEQLICKFIMNNNIINDLFKCYNQYHKLKILLFIDNIMVKQSKRVRDYIMTMGGFDIVKNDLCEYNGNDKNIMKLNIQTLFDIIKAEKPFNNKLLFEKLYNTPIPDKIKEIASNKDLLDESEEIIKSLILDFEKYEKSFENK